MTTARVGAGLPFLPAHVAVVVHSVPGQETIPFQIFREEVLHGVQDETSFFATAATIKSPKAAMQRLPMRLQRRFQLRHQLRGRNPL